MASEEVLLRGEDGEVACGVGVGGDGVGAGVGDGVGCGGADP